VIGPRHAFARLLLPIDTWERHSVVARLAGKPATVLDVGGIPGQLASFFPDASVTAANVEEPADVLFDGRSVPFPDESFDLVTSLDVLEHIPARERAAHFGEVARVARRRVIVCCPVGTDGHVAAERELAHWYAGVTGSRHRFLEEHLERGLPAAAEIESAVATVPSFRLTHWFHGDYRATAEAFRLGVLARTRRRPRDFLAYARARVSARPDYGLAPTPGPYANRVFIVGDRTARSLG
jgi:hypothetical protein